MYVYFLNKFFNSNQLTASWLSSPGQPSPCRRAAAELWPPTPGLFIWITKSNRITALLRCLLSQLKPRWDILFFPLCQNKCLYYDRKTIFLQSKDDCFYLLGSDNKFLLAAVALYEAVCGLAERVRSGGHHAGSGHQTL